MGDATDDCSRKNGAIVVILAIICNIILSAAEAEC